MPEARVTLKQRAAVAERARHCCEYCRSQERYSPDSFSVEHIIPLAKEGISNLDNLAFSCQGCNNRKYISVEALDPVTQVKVSLYHPRQELWIAHFAWNKDCSLVIGLTPTGRATIQKLQLNRMGLVNLRRVLFEFGEHPPNF
ncbi:HNH endonuclease [Iningainema tapete]|uniref:HNH endonuclease n=1 Tax=Iningainema tapete BLCC-T55 TaxID=2748662 RepID=A0A8J6XEA3_9CYAN|nr:HNH endonuclease signature motif containing protein [Iningainema tapete]MBD2771265.1 HNH endonuclease [Iningainema tapete BLCC-T55]